MAMRGRNLMGGRNPGRAKAIQQALREALAGGATGGMAGGMRPRKRPNMMGEAGKTISDADRQRAMDRAGMLQALEAGEMGMGMSDADLAMLRKKLGMMGGGAVKRYNQGGRVDKILRGLGEGSDMSVAALLRMIEGAGMGSGAARAARKAAGMDTRGKGVTRTGRQLNRMGVSDDIIEMLEGTRPGRKAPLQALGFKRGGAVKKTRTKKPKNGCTMKGRGGKYKGMK